MSADASPAQSSLSGGVPLLAVSGLTRSFNTLKVVDDISFVVTTGEIVAMVGPNGAGKSTALSMIAGDLRADAGRIHLAGRDVTRLTPDRRARLGIGRSFQFLYLFEEMTVRENVLIAHERLGFRRGRRADVTETVLAQVGLSQRRDVVAADLSYAEQKFLSLARIMALRPTLALLDEPASGLDGPSLEQFIGLIRALPASGTTVLIVEHNIDVVRALADRVMFLHEGRLLADGAPTDILTSPELAEIYFGSAAGRSS